MTWRGLRAALCGLMLLPLLAFVLGQSLEVAHPIEERAEAHHHHPRDEDASQASLVCGSLHPDHLCSHAQTTASLWAVELAERSHARLAPAPLEFVRGPVRETDRSHLRGPPCLG